LKGILPKTYNAFDKSLLVELLKSFNNIPMDIEGDAFGKIYEYFLGKFAMSEGQKGGEFFTPTSIVKLIVEIIQPFEGKIYDPACGAPRGAIKQYLKGGVIRKVSSMPQYC
jgi:type I restriction enzyme M protein